MRNAHPTICAAQLLHAAQPVTINRNQRSRSPEYALSAQGGHRIVELAAVEAVNGKLTGKIFHTYLNPGRAIDPYAQKVHGLSRGFLASKPRFADIAKGFTSFVQGSECLMHNAAFDTGFINAELEAAGYIDRLQQMV